MLTLIILCCGIYAARKTLKAVPKAVKFGAENPELIRSGASLLKRLLRR